MQNTLFSLIGGTCWLISKLSWASEHIFLQWCTRNGTYIHMKLDITVYGVLFYVEVHVYVAVGKRNFFLCCIMSLLSPWVPITFLCDVWQYQTEKNWDWDPLMVLWFQGVVQWDLGSADLVRSLSIPLTNRAEAEDQRSVNVVRCCGHPREWCTRWQSGTCMNAHKCEDTHKGNVPPLSVLLWTVSWRVKPWPENKSARDTWDNTVCNEDGT